MKLRLLPLAPEDLPVFKKDMQAAFHAGASLWLDHIDGDALPEEVIDQSLSAPGAAAYEALLPDGTIAGGAVVLPGQAARSYVLDLFYVRCDLQGRGLGLTIWKALEAKYPGADCWELTTAYFEKRNLHFYLNRCGFQAVSFFPLRDVHPDAPEDLPGGGYFFRLEKKRPLS